MSSHFLRRWLLLCVAVLAPSLAKASDVPLPVADAIALALKHNEGAAIAELRARKAKAERLEAWSRLLPRANASAVQNWRQPVFREISGVNVLIQGASSRTYNIGADLTLFDAAALASALGAGDGVKASNADLAGARLDLAHAVAEAYAGAYAAERLIAALEERVNVAAQTAAEAALRVRTGLAAPTHQKRIELEQATALVELAQARLDNQSLQSALLELIVLDRMPALTEPVLAKPATSANDATWRQRPDLQALALKAESAKASLNSARLNYLPSLGVGADWRTANDAGLTSNADNWSLFAGAYWTLLDGAGRWARIKARAADAEIAQLTYGAAVRQADLSIARIERERDAATALLDLAKNQFELAKQTADETLLRFKGSLASGLELADALAQQHVAAAGLVKQKLNLDLANLRLARALGQWPTYDANTNGSTP